ncbi:insulinase family protein [Desulfobotulus sp. H1]|uniref:Insulinase family protein n=1 Tax=Desulfobotulus pelophilus TaxID=2823377 RepID=A0ABT3N8K1_9BACT|nr:pitrilysin family protein [Desulfobotulus pelophilus]MCW7753789.1 insulinase family protein [Desulfobotulus pelophilus]
MSYHGIGSRVRLSRIPVIAVTCLFLFAGNLFALPDTRGWIHEKSDLPLHPELITGTLDNGLRYVILPHHTPRNRASLHLNVQAGSFHETDSQQGLAHFVEHMAFNGSTHFPPGTLIHYFQSIGMSFGGDTNAHTGLGETVYHILLPQADAQGLEKGLLVLSDYAHGLLFNENEIEREKGVILAEKRARDSARYRTGQALRRFLLPGIRSNERTPIGKKAVIEKGDRAELLDYYNTWYRPERMMVILVGDVEPVEAESLIAKHFAPIKARSPERQVPEMGEFQHKGNAFFHYAEPESGDVSVIMATSRMVSPRKDSMESRKESLTLQLGSMLLRHRLSDRLSEPDTPYTRAVAMADIQHETILSTRLVAIAPQDKWEASLSSMEQELRKAMTHGFSEEEMDRVRRETLSYLDRRIAGFSTTPSRKIADEIIQAMNTPRVFTSPEDDKALFAGFIEEIQADAVLEVMRKAWGDDHRLIAITGNTGLDDHTALSRMRSVWEKSAAIPVTAPDMAEAAIFPYLPEPERTVQPLEVISIDDLEFFTARFANHITLHVKQTDFEADTVRVLLTFGPGRAHEPEDWPGLSLAAPALVNLSGTGTLDRPALARALAGKGMSVEFSVAQENFRFSASARPEDFSELMNLLRHRLLDPAFRTEAWDLARRWAEQEDRRMDSDISTTMQHLAPSFFASFDPRFSRPKASAMNEAMRLAAENWLAPAFKNAALEITVVGNVNPDLVIEEVGRYFGDLARSSRKEKTIRPLDFNQGARATYWVGTQIPSAQIRIGFPTTGLEPMEESRGLTLLARVLSDRLRTEIREKQGLAYSPRSFHQASSVYKDYGGLYMQTGARPDQAAMVRKALMDVAGKLKKEGVSEEELRRARDPLMTGLKERFRNNNFWLAGVMAGSVEDPRQLDRVRTLESGYLEITAKDLTRLAEKWLQPYRASSITILPVGEEGL